MSLRQTSGSIVCPGCGRLVGVRDEKCLNCGRPHPGLWGWAPVLQRLGRDLGLTQIVIGSCAVLYVAMLLVDVQGIRMSGIFDFLSPSIKGMFLFGASGAEPVFRYHRWWTLLSAAWLHGSLLHILFNMMWVRQLLPATVHFYGAGRAMILYTVSAITGFALSSASFFFPSILKTVMGQGIFTLGASAPLFGLLGALLLYSRRTGSRALGQQIWGWVVVLFLFGFVMRGVDNWAHLGGLLGGYATAKWMDPLTPERGDHLVAGLACLGLSLASIVASVLHGRAFL